MLLNFRIKIADIVDKETTMNKGILCGIFSLLVLFGVNTAVQANDYRDFIFELNSESTGAVITGYVGTTKEVSIPSTIQGVPVISIGRPWPASTPPNPESVFESAPVAVVSVVVPEGVVTIGRSAFARARSLVRVTLPKSLRQIEAYAFAACWSLKSIEVPPSVTIIDSWAFAGCDSLTSVSIPGVTMISHNAFNGCRNLFELKDTGFVKTIADSAFKGCSILQRIQFPNAVNIETRAFADCSNLEFVSLPEQLSVSDDTFIGCRNLALSTQVILRRSGYRGRF